MSTVVTESDTAYEKQQRALAFEANAKLENASAAGDLGLGVRAVRVQARAHLLAGRHRDDPSGRAGAPGIDVIFLDTGYHFVETIGTRDAVQAVYDVNLITLTPKQTVAEQDAAWGKDLFARDPDQCCALRKVEPLNGALDGYAAWATGVRRADSPARAKTPIVGYDAKRKLIKIAPIARWSDADVADYIEQQLPDRQSTAGRRLPLDRLRALHPARRCQ